MFKTMLKTNRLKIFYLTSRIRFRNSSKNKTGKTRKWIESINVNNSESNNSNKKMMIMMIR